MDPHGWLRRLHSYEPGADSTLIVGRSAAVYDRVSGVALGWAYATVADRVTTGLPHGGEVVDVGTGPGRLLLEIARRRPDARVVGIDPSTDMIDHARRRAADAGLSDRVDAVVASAESLPFPDASVDVVVSSLSAHHWQDLAAAVAEQTRVLRPGGQLWVVDLRGASSAAVSEALREHYPADAVTEPRLGALESLLFVCHRAVRPASASAAPPVGGGPS